LFITEATQFCITAGSKLKSHILFHKNGSQRDLDIMTLVAWLLLEEMDGNAFSRQAF
jgi:hypothetical protein